MDQTRLASIVGRSRTHVRGRSLHLLVTALALATVGTARAATLDDPLRFQPSPSTDVIGYVVHVGSASGFFGTGSGTMTDIGSNFQLVNGIGQVPFRTVLSGSAYVVMQAYDSEGLYSLVSNEIYVDIAPPPECAIDADCMDADLCNGAERCVAGSCVAGSDLVCSDPGPCQVGWCDAATGCTSSPVTDGTTCNDGNSTTTGDVCLAGVCTGTVPAPAPDPDPTPTPTPDPGPAPGGQDIADALLYEDFENVPYGELPAEWLVTDAARAVYADKYSVELDELGANAALTVPWSVQGTYFAHFVGDSAEVWTDYELSGRMRADDASGLIGATVVSAHPEMAAYVALVRDASRPSFRLLFVPDDAPLACTGGVDTGFVPVPGEWVSFRLRAIDRTDGLLVQAKVWDERDAEPAAWAVDCLAEGRSLREGRPGVIAGGPGSKLFDDLGVWRVLDLDAQGGATAPLYAEDFEGYAVGDKPGGWQDVVMGGVIDPADPLFHVESNAATGLALSVAGGDQSVAASLTVPGATEWQDYEVTGRMMTEDTRAHYGLLVNSHVHEGGGALGLRYSGIRGKFGVGLTGANASAKCVGSSELRYRAREGAWHRFRLRVVAEGASVRVRARVWRDGQIEPTKDWPVDCVTTPGEAPMAGTLGVYSIGSGAKHWDDLAVRAVDGP